MKKLLIYLIALSIIFTASCTSAERNKSLINYDSYTDNLYPDYRNHPQSQYLSKNQNLVSYFYSENIKEYKYALSGNTLRIWIKNFEIMPEEQITKIKNDLKKFYNNIEIVKNEEDIE
ncbi:MAG: hypothetical protein AAGU14_05970 [Eubacteriaceae bacterium]